MVKISEQHLEKSGKSLTTLAGFIAIKKSIFVFNVGDSRIYSFYKGNLEKLSEDHIITLNDTSLKMTSYLEKYVGGKEGRWYPTIKDGKIINNNGIVFLCSDGIYKCITENQISMILNSTESLSRKSKQLDDLIENNQIKDDYSYIIISIQ